MRIWRSERPSRGPERDGESSTAERACRELEKSPAASAMPLRCMTTVSIALRRALSWFSRASRYILRSWNH